MSSGKRKCYSIGEKNVMLQRLESGVSNINVAKEFGVSHSTLCSIKKNKDKIRTMVKANILKSKRFRTSNQKQVEHALLQFIKTNHEHGGKPLSGVMLQEKANLLAKQLNIFDFNCSSGWINRFKTRHNLKKSKETLPNEQYDISCNLKGTTNSLDSTDSTDEQFPSHDTFTILSFLDPALNPKSAKSTVSNISENSLHITSREKSPEDMKKSFEITLPEAGHKRSRFAEEQEEEDYDRLNVDNTVAVFEESTKSDIWDVVGKFVAANGREWAKKNFKLANQFKAAIYKLLAEFEEKAAEIEEPHQMTLFENSNS